MFFDWSGRPALMMPTLAYTVQRPGGGWVRASAARLACEAKPVSEREFWQRFEAWGLPDFPVAFSQIDRRRGRSGQSGPGRSPRSREA